MAMRRVSKNASPVKRIMSGAQRFSINTKDDHILPSSTSTSYSTTNSSSFSPSEEDNKYNKRKYKKKKSFYEKIFNLYMLMFNRHMRWFIFWYMFNLYYGT